MEKQHNLPHLEAKLKELKEVCASLSDDSDLTEMLKIIHRPGWTTVAEFSLVSATVESLVTHARSLLAQRKSLVASSREIETGRPAAV